ncbi:hypothetical protein PFISCL1PPCAC_3721, partial [Pristionchus fissidentatus]
QDPDPEPTTEWCSTNQHLIYALAACTHEELFKELFQSLINESRYSITDLLFWFRGAISYGFHSAHSLLNTTFADASARRSFLAKMPLESDEFCEVVKLFLITDRSALGVSWIAELIDKNERAARKIDVLAVAKRVSMCAKTFKKKPGEVDRWMRAPGRMP